MMNSSILHFCLLIGIALVPALVPGLAQGQTLIAADDSYGIPSDEPLVVEPLGVLDNDTLDGEPAGENGATAELLVDVTLGSLSFLSDGSFTYDPGPTFDGVDTFSYRAVFGSIVDTATVTLSACSGGPLLFECWNENAYRIKGAELGFSVFSEGFEDDLAWGAVRSPNAADSVTSQGIRWKSNHPDPPASNGISTTSGAAWTGAWGVYDPEHGYATGTEVECDVDNPPEHCLYYDGVTGTREAGTLHGVGAYVHGIYGANVTFLLDGGAPFGGGRLGINTRFFGVIDASPAGFTQFQLRELDGKIGQALYIWADDFTFLTADATAVRDGGPPSILLQASPNPVVAGTTLHFSIPGDARVALAVYDVSGRRIRLLLEGELAAGSHRIRWDGRTDDGEPAPNGVYFARLVLDNSGQAVGAEKLVLQR